MQVRRILCYILVMILLFGCTGVLADEPATGQNDDFKIRQILLHDALNEISLTGSKCLGAMPTSVPVKNQHFTKAVATIAVKSDNMKVSDVIFRLAPNYIEEKLNAGEIVVMSAWMRADGESGKASASVETKNNEVKASTNSVNLTNEWKKYYFISEITTNMDTVKASIFVGYSEQITYLSEWTIEAYLNTDINTVKIRLLGDESGNNKSDITAEVQETLNTEKKSALINASVYISGVPDAYINDVAYPLDESSSEIAPYMKDNNIFIPLRFAAERYGATVEYVDSDPCVIVILDGKKCIMKFDDSMWKFNGKPWSPSHSLETVGGRTYICADDFSGILGLIADVDIEKKLCIFTNNENEMEILSKFNYKNEIYEKVSLIAHEIYTISWEHDNMPSEIGLPALIKATDDIPVLKFNCEYDARISYDVLHDNSIVSSNNIVDTKAANECKINISDNISEPESGEWRVDLRITVGNSLHYDSLYFFVEDDALKPDDSKVLYKNSAGLLISVPDYRGNRIPDYSDVGYKAGKEKIPDAPTVIELTPSGGDDTDNLEEAIKYVSGLPHNKDGIRGAIQFSKGVFQISRPISINTSGLVFRGFGNDNPNVVDAEPTGPVDKYIEKHKDTQGTILLLTSKTPQSCLFTIHGKDIRIDYDSETSLIENYVPTGTKTFLVENAAGYCVGDQIIIKQHGNMAWVHEIGMDKIPDRTTADANVQNNEDSATHQWTEKNWSFERNITAIDGNRITVDVPVVNAIDKKYGGAVMYKFTDEDRLENIGMENMRVVAAWTPNENNADDTLHASILVSMRKAKNLWVRDITAEHFNTNCIAQGEQLKCVTIQDFYNLIAPPSYYMGPDYEETGRTNLHTSVYVGRYGVYLYGQQVLVQRFHGTNNRHLVEYGGEVAGPNVAYDCESVREFNIMGPHYFWSTGGLYDNVYGGLAIQNRLNMGSGHGWAGAWFTSWNCDAGDSAIAVQKPPTAQNWAIGNVGKRYPGDFKEFEQGYWDLEGTHSNIESLFVAQKEANSGQEGLNIIFDKAEYDCSLKEVPTDLYATSIEIDGKPLKHFDKSTYAYDYVMSNSLASERMPVVTASSEYDVEIKQAQSVKDYAIVTVTDGEYRQQYLIHFKVSPYKSFVITCSEDDGNVAENVADGDLITRWSASGDGQWLSFEFDSPAEISQIGISFYNGTQRSTKFDIEVSDDGVSWRNILSETSSGFTDDVEKYSVTPFTSKYVRFVGHGNSINLWNSIQEFEFYDKNGDKLFDD